LVSDISPVFDQKYPASLWRTWHFPAKLKVMRERILPSLDAGGEAFHRAPILPQGL
jgi:hypothetical protein